MEEIKRHIRRVIVDALRLNATPDHLGDDEDLSDRLGVDSVGFLEILMTLEEEFNVHIQDVNVSRKTVGTVNKLAALVSHAASEAERQ